MKALLGQIEKKMNIYGREEVFSTNTVDHFYTYFIRVGILFYIPFYVKFKMFSHTQALLVDLSIQTIIN